MPDTALEHPTNGSAFNVRDVTFRCIATLSEVPLFECNRCTAVVTEPERHLRYNH